MLITITSEVVLSLSQYGFKLHTLDVCTLPRNVARGKIVTYTEVNRNFTTVHKVVCLHMFGDRIV